MREKQSFICISCPVGCQLTVEEAENGVTVSGNACPRGKTYGEREFTAPERVVTSSVAVEGGVRPLVPCKTRAPIPKARVPEALAAIRKAAVPAPVALGQVLLENVADTGVDVIATRENGRGDDAWRASGGPLF